MSQQELNRKLTKITDVAGEVIWIVCVITGIATVVTTFSALICQLAIKLILG